MTVRATSSSGVVGTRRELAYEGRASHGRGVDEVHDGVSQWEDPDTVTPINAGDGEEPGAMKSTGKGGDVERQPFSDGRT